MTDNGRRSHNGGGRIFEIIFPAIVVLLAFYMFIFYYLFPCDQVVYPEDCSSQFEEMINPPFAVLAHYNKLVTQSKIPLEDAKRSCIQIIGQMYCSENSRYSYWILDSNVNVISACCLERTGKGRVDSFRVYMDKESIKEIIKVAASEAGEGYIFQGLDYKSEPDDAMLEQSYVRGFQSWGWIIGITRYVNNTKGGYNNIRKRVILLALSVGLVVLIIVGGFTLQVYHSERSLAISESYSKHILSSAPDGFVLLKGMTIADCNQRVCEILGYRQDELMGLPTSITWAEYQPDGRNSNKAVIDIIERIKHENIVHFEWLHKKKDGANILLDIRLTRIFIDGEEYYLAFSRDITQRKSIEQKVRDSEENLRITLNSIGDAVISTDLNGCIVRMNPIAQNLTGWKEKEVIGRKFSEVVKIVDVEYRQNINDLAKQALDSGKSINLGTNSLLYSRDGSEYRIADSAAPIRDEKGVLMGVVIVLHDITNEYQLQMQLNQSQKLDAVGQLANGIAHDFNNMLGGIMGALGILEKRLAKNKNEMKFVSLAMNATMRASELVNKLLAFSRQQAIAVIPVDLHATIQAAVDILSSTIDKRIKIELAFRAQQSTILGDAPQLQNVFMNLGINASHAMPEGGMFSIFTDVVKLSDPYCQSSTLELKPGSYLKVEVKDTGCGIAPQNITRIFEPFFTTKEMGKGTGLGLSTIFGTMRQHKGDITVCSVVGRGTSFCLYFPLTHEQSRDLPEKLEPVHGQGLILLIDDEYVMRDTGKVILEDLGYDVITAKDGEEGLKVFQENAGTFRLVILDMIMPKMSGRDCFRTIRQIDSKLPIILCSGIIDKEDVDDLLRQGRTGFIQKPYDVSRLSRIVAEVLNDYWDRT